MGANVKSILGVEKHAQNERGLRWLRDMCLQTRGSTNRTHGTAVAASTATRKPARCCPRKRGEAQSKRRWRSRMTFPTEDKEKMVGGRGSRLKDDHGTARTAQLVKRGEDAESERRLNVAEGGRGWKRVTAGGEKESRRGGCGRGGRGRRVVESDEARRRGSRSGRGVEVECREDEQRAAVVDTRGQLRAQSKSAPGRRASRTWRRAQGSRRQMKAIWHHGLDQAARAPPPACPWPAACGEAQSIVGRPDTTSRTPQRTRQVADWASCAHSSARGVRPAVCGAARSPSSTCFASWPSSCS